MYSCRIRLVIPKFLILIFQGTGSGSLSSSLATAVGPKGFLYTFEFNEDRAVKARKEFETLGFNNIRVTWRDACGDGFLPKEGDDYTLKDVDAVFLDLPKPWEAIGHADKVLKRGGRVCCFSPCIEQVQKTCLELKSRNYADVRTFECIGRTYERRKNPHKSFRQSNENKRRRGQEIQGEKAVSKKEKVEVNEGDETTIREIEVPTETATAPEEGKEANVAGSTTAPAQEQAGQEIKGVEELDQKQSQQKRGGQDQQDRFYFSSGSQYSQGHTGYLTFAIKL